jgi:hypothetical protein
MPSVRLPSCIPKSEPVSNQPEGGTGIPTPVVMAIPDVPAVLGPASLWLAVRGGIARVEIDADERERTASKREAALDSRRARARGGARPEGKGAAPSFEGLIDHQMADHSS